MKFYPFAYWLGALAVGIFIANKFRTESPFIWLALVLVFVSLSLICISKKNKLFLGLVSIVFMVIIGFFIYQFHHQKSTNHYALSEERNLYQLEIKTSLKPSKKYYKYKAKVGVEGSNVSNNLSGFVLLYNSKNNNELHVGDKVWIEGKIQSIRPPLNPHQFNYKNYLFYQKIDGQIFSDTILKKTEPSRFSLKHQVSAEKINIKKRLKESGFNEEARLFIHALALGDRTQVSEEWQQKFSTAGITHLLAISGLHIGIVFGLFYFLFSPLLYLPHGRKIRLIVALLMIWLFAFFVGFSPSVIRAAFMISFYSVTLLLHRPPNLFHTLSVTAFVILLFAPDQLFDVGFQLSYAAVFFIAWLSPTIQSWLPNKRGWKDYLINLTSVTIAAQMGVMPISIFYFHQFSGLFLVANLMFLPLALLLVVISFCSVIIALLPFSITFWVWLVNLFFEFSGNLISSIANHKQFVFGNINWEWYQVILILFVLVLIPMAAKKFKPKYVLAILSLVFLFQVTEIYHNHQSSHSSELIVFQQYKGTMIGVREGMLLNVFWEVEDSVKTINYVLKPYLIKEGIKQVDYNSLQAIKSGRLFHKTTNIIQFQNRKICIINSKIDSIPKVDYLILTQSKWENKAINQSFQKIITDGSNYPSKVKKLRHKLKYSARLWNTAEQGAFRVIIN